MFVAAGQGDFLRSGGDWDCSSRRCLTLLQFLPPIASLTRATHQCSDTERDENESEAGNRERRLKPRRDCICGYRETPSMAQSAPLRGGIDYHLKKLV